MHSLCNMDKHFYVTLFSNASQKRYPGNTLSAFTVHLAQLIDLNLTDKWEVGVCELTYQQPQTGTFRGVAVVGDKNALIYCNSITQFMGSQYVLCLRPFIRPSTYCNHIFENMYYRPVEKRRFQDILIEILTLKGTAVSFIDSKVPTKIVLHFLRVSTW